MGFIAKILFFFILSILFPVSSNGQNPNLIKEIESLLLKSEWDSLYELIHKSPESLSNDPIIRMINGHTCLAINKNNESIYYFLETQVDSLLNEWFNYTKSLTVSNPKNAVAYYLAGDAYARLKQYDEAILYLDKSLGINPNFVLALVSKAVINAKNGNIDYGFVYFVKICQQFPDHIDAKLSLAIIYLKYENFPEAENLIDQILTINDEVAMAHFAKASILKTKGEAYQNQAITEFRIALLQVPELTKIIKNEK